MTLHHIIHEQLHPVSDDLFVFNCDSDISMSNSFGKKKLKLSRDHILQFQALTTLRVLCKLPLVVKSSAFCL